MPAQGEELAEVVNEIGGASLLLDITDEDAPARLAEHLEERHGGADAVIHNAGVTRDRTVARMSEDEWDLVLAINLTAQERINEALLDGGVLREGGRIVTVSSIGGIAGNRGQTNYGASKAGVIGIVESLAPVLAEHGQTINAVAPGLHRDEDDRGDAARHARGGAAHELGRAGRAAGRRRGDDRVAGEPGLGRRQRQRRAGLRPEPDRGMTVRELASPPSLTALYPRAVGVPLLRKLPGLGASRELPDTELEVRDVATDPEHLAAYDEVCGFAREDVLPPTYPHIVAFPLAVRIMAERAFPFPLLGLVHIGNEIDQRRPIGAGEPLCVRVRAQDLEPHDRGTQFAMAAEARVGEELVWSSRNVYLHRSASSGSRRPGPQGARGRAGPAPARAHWRVPADIGRRYGAVSGDRNPIHLHGWSAKLFGMPRPIAHGMWVKARCLAELESTLPDAFTVDVRFKLPLFLPAQVAFGVGDGGAFEVRDASSGKPHLSGTLTEGA